MEFSPEPILGILSLFFGFLIYAGFMSGKKKKEEPAVIVDKDKIRVMPNSPTVQSSHFEPPLKVYYPAGQRILKKKGLENNYENFMQEFGSHINDEDRAIINSNDPERINSLITNKSRPRAIKKTSLLIFKTLLTACVLTIIGVPTYLYVQNGIEDADVNLLIIFTPFVVIVFLISYYKTIRLTEIVDGFSIPMDAGNLNINR